MTQLLLSDIPQKAQNWTLITIFNLDILDYWTPLQTWNSFEPVIRHRNTKQEADDTDDLAKGIQKLRLDDPRWLFDQLPVELTTMILQHLPFCDLLAITKAWLPFYIIAERNNLFTKAAIRNLESRGINILPHDVVVPTSILSYYIVVEVNGMYIAGRLPFPLSPNLAHRRQVNALILAHGTEIQLRAKRCLASGLREWKEQC